MTNEKNRPSREDIEKIYKQVSFAAKAYMNGYSKQDLRFFESWIEAQINLHNKGYDECPVCKSNPENQIGGIPCNYCGAIGLMPWGG